MSELWRFPFNLPRPPDGVLHADDIVRIMEEQAASIAPGDPQHAAAQFELMRAYGLAGRLDDSRAVLQGLLDNDGPLDAKARAAVVLGASAERARDFVTAVEIYRMAVELDPSLYWGHNNLAYSLSQLGRHQEAEPEARAAIAVEPAAFNAHKNLGVALEGLGHYAEAARSYLLAIRAEPFERRAYNHLEQMIARNPATLREVEGLAEEMEFYQPSGLVRRLTERARNDS